MAVIAKQRYKLDIAPKGGWVIVYASQHDDGAREIEFEITNQGRAFLIPGLINVSVQGMKSNSDYFSHSCSYSGNVVTMALADDMTDVIGKAICVLKFTNSSNQKLATAKFILNVDSDSSSEGIIVDTEAKEIFNQMLDEIRAQAASVNAEIAELQSMVGSPLVASTVSAMTNYNKIYVYTGSESGYTNGNWYYWSGSAWTSGGVYNSVAFETDTTLTQSGQAADAKVVGDKVGELKEELNSKTNYNEYTDNVLGLVIPYNIFDVNHVEEGYTNGLIDKTVIDGTTGNIRSTTSNVVTSYMFPIYNKKKIVLKSGSQAEQTVQILFRVAAYDVNGETVEISGTNVTEYVLPSNAYYCRFSFSYGTGAIPVDITVCDDNTAPTKFQNYFEPYSSALEEIDKSQKYNKYSDSILGLIIPYNLFNKDHIESGYTNGWLDKHVINIQTGELRSTTANIAGSYIFPLYNKKKLCLKFGSGQILATLRNVAFYDADGTYMCTVWAGWNIVDVPFGAYYARIEFFYSDKAYLSNKITVCDDSVVGTPYQNYFAPYSKEGRDTYKTPNLMQIFPKFSGIGDSLMGGFMNRDGVSITTATAREAGNNWFNYLMIRLGRAGTNLAVGGSTAKQWREELLSSANIDTDCYIIGIGVNDKRHALTIGSASDIASSFADNADSFYGNYDYILRQLMAWKPAAHIFCFTIPEIEGGNSADYNTAIKAITALYSEKVHCIDLRNEFYADLLSDAMVTTNYTGGHFNPISYNYMSTVIQTAIDNFMYDNQGLFATAPYA